MSERSESASRRGLPVGPIDPDLARDLAGAAARNPPHHLVRDRGCRRPAVNCDFEHSVPYEAAGRTCLCNGNPKCRRDHRLKQDPRWKSDQLPSGQVRWTTPTGRQYVTEPTRYPI